MPKKKSSIRPPEFGGTSEGQFMKRTVSWSVDGFHWNADNSHGEKVVRYCFPDMQEATRRLTSPGSNHIGKSARDAGEELVDEKRDEYRSMARTDLQYTTSVLMRNVETSLKMQEMQLMRRANYISAVREWGWDFQHQEMPDEVYVEVDSDWAQCPRTCRSTGAGLPVLVYRCWSGVLEEAFAGQLRSATAHDITRQR